MTRVVVNGAAGLNSGVTSQGKFVLSETGWSDQCES